MKNRTHSTISANVLFHFTRSKENLIGILQREFYPRYALENMNLLETEIPARHMAIPMVSFCDIPLSQVKDHIKHYGEYALGLTKAWGKSHGIAPVLYAYPKALTSRAINSIYLHLPPTVQPRLAQAQWNLFYFSLFIKQYEGHIYSNGHYLPDVVRFYNEREWRYVPPVKFFIEREDVDPFLPKDVFDNKDSLLQKNDYIAQAIRLSFEPKYIRYVIVKSDDEILEIMDAISRIKGPNFPPDDVSKLKTRIITMEQILEDF